MKLITEHLCCNSTAAYSLFTRVRMSDLQFRLHSITDQAKAIHDLYVELRMKRWLCGLCLLLAMVILITGCGKQKTKSDGVSAHGQLVVRDGILTDAHGEPFQLRGLSTHGIAWYPQYINAGSFQSVKDAGGNVLRIAMYTDTENGYLADPETNTAWMLQAIENARALDMYVLVDWHILSDGDPNADLDAAITFFDAIAGRYPGDPAILYEICNEPNGVDWEAIQSYAYAIFPVIRQYSPDAVIILGTPDYSGDLRQPLLHPFPGENFLYAYHFYAGLHPDYNLLEYAVEHRLPVMVSEWGIDYDEAGTPALDAGREFADYMNTHGISWCAWSLCNKDEVYSVLQPDCSALSNWQDADLTETGRVIFRALRGSET